jgi:signal transduction histidine kinase
LKEPGSIRGRVLRTQLLWSLLGGLALTLAMWLALEHEVDELMDDALRSAAVGVLGPVLSSSVTGPLPAPARQEPAEGPNFVWQVVAPGARAQVLASSAGAPMQALQGTPSAGFGDLPEWRLFGLSLGPDGRMLYVAQTRQERSEARLELLLAVLLAGLPMLLLGLWWLNVRLRHDLRPLQLLPQRLAAFDPLHPGATLGLAGADELSSVQDAIDALGGRLARRVEQERAFTAHAAHALRTPLAGIDAQLAVALREAPVELRPRLQRVRDAAVRLQRVVAALLTMFRSGVEVERRPLDLAQLVGRLPVEGLKLETRATEVIQGDADLLTAALLNLLDNAQRHGAVTVVLSTPRPGVLRLEDDGAGIEPTKRSQLQAALLEQDYAGRMGLGLMLGDLVARAHGGVLRLAPSDRGFVAELHLPSPQRSDNPVVVST